jgi:hypothetical protein
MPALNFQNRFAAKIKGGSKRCTIRAPRKREIRVGDTLHLFTGMRTKACRKLKVAVCRQTHPIIISRGRDGSPVIKLNHRRLTLRAALGLARCDGHATLQDFTTFFATTHGLPFAGCLVCW